MTKKIRMLILLVCVACFFIIAPILVLHSMGYRINFKDLRITATGGIYVRTFPAAERITIDEESPQKPGMFSNSIFIQNLLPNEHSVLVQKNGYYDYAKTITVQKNQVAKLENILLLKQNIVFRDALDNVGYFSVAPNKQMAITASFNVKNTVFNYFNLSSGSQPQTFSIEQAGQSSDIKWSDDSLFALIKIQNKNNIYHYLFDSSVPLPATPSASTSPSPRAQPQKPAVSLLSFLDKNTQQISFNPQNSKELFFMKNGALYSETNNKASAIITGAIAYKTNGSDIIWLSANGLLNNSDTSGRLISRLTEKGISVGTGQFGISVSSNEIFLQTDNSLFLLDRGAKTFKNIPLPSGTYKTLSSVDQKNMIYWNDKEIYVSSLSDKHYEKLFSGEQINSCQWLNNNYIIFSAGDEIIISEIDYRGNINAITLPQTIIISPDKKINISNPEIFFNQQDGKLYLLSGNTLISSEKILP